METTIRFGSACGPRTTATSERATEENDKGTCDSDKLVQCPYDKNHQIRMCRFPYHVIKCRKNHPELASQLKTCPYNARHIVPKHELARHTQTCEDKVSMEELTNGNAKCQVPSTAWMDPHMTENWDNELDDYATPFVWGSSTSGTLE